MKTIRLLAVGLALFVGASVVSAQQTRLASEEDIKLLKKDLLDGQIIVGKTRLSKISTAYGEAAAISENEKSITYNYGNIRIDFEKKRLLKDWEYDSSQGYAYTDSIDNLRFDLEDGQIVGDFVTFRQIQKDYDDPTKAMETDEDGAWSIYYYGDIKLVFENSFVVTSWRGSGLAEASDGILSSDPAASSDSESNSGVY